jgi:hypothetical protein
VTIILVIPLASREYSSDDDDLGWSWRQLTADRCAINET